MAPIKHGFAVGGKKRFYHIWLGLQARTYRKSGWHFQYYKGRGIRNLWGSFIEFRNTMFVSYEAHCKLHGEQNTTLERTENNGHYSQDNCRWATKKEQARNRTTTHLITWEGKCQSLATWAEDIGISQRTLMSRISRGWNTKDLLTRPVKSVSQLWRKS